MQRKVRKTIIFPDVAGVEGLCGGSGRAVQVQLG